VAPEKIKFHYLKSQLFRIIRADGAYGGITPRLGVFLSFYSERPPIPTVMVHDVGDDGILGEERRSERQTRDGIIREAEVGVILDLDTAKSLATWLGEKILEAEKLQAQAKKSEAEKTSVGKPDLQ
jgi:hypothetical protein